MFKAGLLPRDSANAPERRQDAQRPNLLVSEQAVRTQEQRIKQEEANLESAQLRPEQGAHGLADRRHRHAAQHRRGRNGGRRHHEQRRHGAARRSPTCRSSRPRSKSTKRTSRSSRSASPRRSRSTRFPTKTFPGPGDRGRQQPDSGDGRGQQPAARRTSRWSYRSTARCRTCGRASRARRR